MFLYVLKILYWKSLKSKEVKHWWLKMENLCALMEYFVWNIIFQNALLSLVWTFSFTLFYLTFTLPHYNQKIRPFDSCIVCNMLLMEMRLKNKLIIEHIHWLNLRDLNT
jgi:hypothetical protein